MISLSEPIKVHEGCYVGCFYYTDSCFRKDCKMNTSIKQTCSYIEAYHVKVGESACVYAIDHPTAGTNVVRTSAVQSYDIETGRFETRNTIYTKADA